MKKLKLNGNFQVMYVLVTILIFISPIIASLVLTIIVMKSNKQLDYMLLAFSFAMIAFYWDPGLRGPLYDLIRHHLKYNMMTDVNIFELFMSLSLFKPLQEIFVWTLSRFANKNLLQFAVTFLTMGFLFEIIRVISLKYSIYNRVVLFLIIISSIRFIMVISNLWSDLAVVIMCYSILIVDNRKKQIILSLVSVGLHFSLVIPLTLFILYRYLGISFKGIIIFIGVLLVSPILVEVVLGFLANISNINIVSIIHQRFIAYSAASSDTLSIYNIRFYLLELMKPIFILFTIYLGWKFNFIYDRFGHRTTSVESRGFSESIILSVFCLVLGVKYNVLLRFTFMCVLLFSPFFIPIIDKISQELKKKSAVIYNLYIIIVCIFIFSQLIYQINGLYHAFIFKDFIQILF